MNYNQFVAAFPKLDKDIRAAEARTEKQEEMVVLAATVMAATDGACHIDINGAYYEVSPKDVIDIQVLSPTAEHPPAAEAKPHSGKGAEAAAKKGPPPPASSLPPVALIKLKRSAVLSQKLQVPAALLAAAGTWMQVVPAAVQ